MSAPVRSGLVVVNAPDGCEPGARRAAAGRPSGRGSCSRRGGARTSRPPSTSDRPAPWRAAGGRGRVRSISSIARLSRSRRAWIGGLAATASATSSQVIRSDVSRPFASRFWAGVRSFRGSAHHGALLGAEHASACSRLQSPCDTEPRARPARLSSGAILCSTAFSAAAKASCSGLRGDRDVGRSSERGEERLEPVVVGRRDRVELVVVAAGAADRQAEEDRADGAGDLGQLRLPLDLGDDVAADHLARAAPAEAGGDQGVVIAGQRARRRRVWRVDEPIVGHVGVQGADDPVAIPPGVGPLGVELEAVGVGVMGQVEPVLAPALAVPRAREQAIDQPLVGVGPAVAEERVDLVRVSAAGRSGRR